MSKRSNNIVYKCTVLIGAFPSIKVRYWIGDKIDGCYIETEFSSLGPMPRADAELFLLRFGD